MAEQNVLVVLRVRMCNPEGNVSDYIGGNGEGIPGFSQESFVEVRCRFEHESLKLEIVATSKFVASHVGFDEVNCFGVCFVDAVGDHYGNSLARNVLNMSKARVDATLWLALSGIDRLDDVHRRKSDFYVTRGNPHGGRWGCASGDQSEWIIVGVLF